MTPIQNSPIKEGIRQRNEAVARDQEYRINQQLNNQVSQFRKRSKVSFSGFAIAGVVLGIVLGIAMNDGTGFVIGFILCCAAWLIINQGIVKGHNSEIDKKIQRLQSQANSDIAAAYSQADNKTMHEIAAYEAEVDQYCKKIVRNAENLTPMVENVISMMNRMISHADTRSHMRFVEADLVYQVITTGIKYSYLSKYTNPQDDYIFDVARYHDLNTDAECEGLAQALAKLTIKRMKATNPANSFNITVDHSDAQVTLHYKGANKNFVPGRDIF